MPSAICKDPKKSDISSPSAFTVIHGLRTKCASGLSTENTVCFFESYRNLICDPGIRSLYLTHDLFPKNTISYPRSLKQHQNIYLTQHVRPLGGNYYIRKAEAYCNEALVGCIRAHGDSRPDHKGPYAHFLSASC